MSLPEVRALSYTEELAPLWDVWIHILEIVAECACWGRVARVYRSYKGGCGSLPPHPALRATFPPRGRFFGGNPLIRP